MNLTEALLEVAIQLGLNGQELVQYAAADDIPGSLDWPAVTESRDHHAIPYTADGKFLYALVRALKPARVLESGTSYGGSAEHIALALRDAGQGGRLVTVDISDQSATHIRSELREYVDVVFADIRTCLDDDFYKGFSFIHEDASHESDTVDAVYRRLHKLSAPEGCVIVSHDTALGVGDYIRASIKACGFSAKEYVYEESPCGFSVLRYQP